MGKQLAVLAIATLAFWTPSIAPTPAGVDTAYAHGWNGWTPWPAFYVMAGAGSVITNAVYVWNPQCRELSSKEAVVSTALPFVGIAFDAQASKCRR